MYGRRRIGKRLCKSVMSCLNDDYCGNTLYDIAVKLGLNVSCTGNVEGISLDGKIFTMYYASDRCEQSEFRKALKYEFPGMRILFNEFGYGSGVFKTNDSELCYFYRYIVFNDDLTVCEGFSSLSEVMDYLTDEYWDRDVKRAVLGIDGGDGFCIGDDDSGFKTLADVVHNSGKGLHLVEVEVVD